MSTEPLDLSGLPDEGFLQDFANRFFAAPPVPQGAAVGVPASLAGSGISPAALQQDNSIDLKDPPTSLPDPHFASPSTTYADLSGTSLPIPSSASKLPFTSDAAFYFINEKSPFIKPRQTLPANTALPSAPYDVNKVRRDFPILQQYINGHPLVWLDNAATTQKPQSVIDRISHFYEQENSNIHRAAHELAARSTDAYEGAREKVRQFLNASSPNEIVFVRGATEAINLVAKSWGHDSCSPVTRSSSATWSIMPTSSRGNNWRRQKVLN